MAQGISVIICCFNSAARLAPTLEHLYKQKNIPLSSWEVIVVNNCSTDDTAARAAEIWGLFPPDKPDFSLVNEQTPGLSSARQRGIDESRYDFVLFCDDDNWLEENYLSNALNIMQNNLRIGALGGNGSPVFEKEEPPYFWANQYAGVATGDQSAIDGDITDERGVLYGAGMILNKSAYKILKEEYNFQFLLSDRIGNTLISSGDHELCLALRKIGYRIFYSKNLHFKHYLPASRTQITYYKRLYFGMGISYAMLHVYRVSKKDLNTIKNDYRYIVLRCLKNILVLMVKFLIDGYYFGKNKYKYADQLYNLYSSAGQAKAMLKVKNLYKKQFLTIPLFNGIH